MVLRAYAAATPNTSALGVLTEAYDKTLTVEEDSVGSGGFSIHAEEAQAAWCAPGNFVKFYRDSIDGEPLGGIFLNEYSPVIVSDTEEGGRVLSLSGEGPLTCFNEAILWFRAYRRGKGKVERRRGRWRWRNVQLATVLLRCLREAKRRGCVRFVTADFTSLRDSDGLRWDDDTFVRRYSIPIGVTLNEAVTMLRAKGLRITMTGDFVLQARPDDRTTDRSGTVRFEVEDDIRGEVQSSRSPKRARSVALVAGERRRNRGNRYAYVRSKAIQQDIGRRKEGFHDLGRTATKRVLRRAGRKRLRKWKRRFDGALALPVVDRPGQLALVHYFPGDTVYVSIPDAYNGPERIVSITLTENTSNGEYDPTLEFGHMTPDRTGEDWSDDAATAERS